MGPNKLISQYLCTPVSGFRGVEATSETAMEEEGPKLPVTGPQGYHLSLSLFNPPPMVSPHPLLISLPGNRPHSLAIVGGGTSETAMEDGPKLPVTGPEVNANG